MKEINLIKLDMIFIEDKHDETNQSDDKHDEMNQSDTKLLIIKYAQTKLQCYQNRQRTWIM